MFELSDLLFVAGGFFIIAALIALFFVSFSYRKGRNAQETAEIMITDTKEKSDSLAFTWLRGAGWIVAPLALPVGAAAVVAGYVAKAASQGISVRRQKMPEYWYEQVVAESSEVGKAYLGHKLEKQGYITVAQAAYWLKMESKQKAQCDTSKSQLIETHVNRLSFLKKMRNILKN